ncbi:glutamate receptor ionotropic, kainate 3-like [Penaeus japonicus]|uniref:glutamate receptor ionotropic, kainate 3-like n=1 Tax=Penaeus japonicus TaxID=27405 RepID=UPI001C71719B|nr:glutamate receptor ionotropic, kainate 3-like [Penaeus japonicus]
MGLPLSVTSERLLALDFTETVFIDEFIVTYKRPDLKSDITGFTKPFAPMLWLTVFFAATLVCAATWMILRSHARLIGTRPSDGASGKKYTSAHGEKSLLWTLCHLISQPVPWEPVGYAARAMGGLWLLAAFILGLVYRGNLKAMLILPRVELPFNNLQELADSDVTIWNPGSHIAYQMIMAAHPDSHYGAIGRRSFVHMRIEEGIRDAHDGKHATISTLLAALSDMDRTFSRIAVCPLYVVSEHFLRTVSMAIPIGKKSDLKPKLNKAIVRMKEFGIIDQIFKKELANGTLCLKPPSHTVNAGDLRALDIVDFFGVFAIYAVGIILSCGSFAQELFFGRKKKHQKKIHQAAIDKP